MTAEPLHLLNFRPLAAKKCQKRQIWWLSGTDITLNYDASFFKLEESHAFGGQARGECNHESLIHMHAELHYHACVCETLARYCFASGCLPCRQKHSGWRDRELLSQKAKMHLLSLLSRLVGIVCLLELQPWCWRLRLWWLVSRSWAKGTLLHHHHRRHRYERPPWDQNPPHPLPAWITNVSVSWTSVRWWMHRKKVWLWMIPLSTAAVIGFLGIGPTAQHDWDLWGCSRLGTPIGLRMTAQQLGTSWRSWCREERFES